MSEEKVEAKNEVIDHKEVVQPKQTLLSDVVGEPSAKFYQDYISHFKALKGLNLGLPDEMIFNMLDGNKFL